MAGEGGAPPLPPDAAAGWTGGAASFDAVAFFAEQQRQQEEQRALQGQQLQAVADMLLPSSSESEESSGKEEAPRAAAAGGAERRRRRSRSVSSSEGERRRSKKRRREGKEKRKKEGREERRRRKERERRHRARESEREQQVRLERQTGAAQRAPQVKAWAGSGAASKEPFYFDSRGDPANLAFGGLYRGDVARYRRYDPAGFAASLGAARRGPGLYGVRVLATEADGHLQQDRSRRYFGAPMQRAERSAQLKRWRRTLQQGADAELAAQAPAPAGIGLLLRKPPGAAQQAAQPESRRRGMDLPSPSFLPLALEAAAPVQQDARGLPLSAAEELAAEQAAATAQGETNEELLLRRTRDFNRATRERPYDVQLWLRFAEFQDEAVRLGAARRGVERGAAEKKIAILEKALSQNPGSDELLLALLQAAEAVCDDAELERRWRGVLAIHSGSPRLWRAYLHQRRTRFAGFSAPALAAAYDDAFAALHREHQQRAAKGGRPQVLAQLEAEAAALALEGISLRLAAGATEAAVAALAVLLEFNFFAPEGWPEDALALMFREFWTSGAPLVGWGPEAAGWGAWMAGEPAASQAAAAAAAPGSAAREQQAAEAAAEGPAPPPPAQAAEQPQAAASSWSGWEELAPAIRARYGHSLRLEPAEAEEPAAAAPAGQGSGAGDPGEGVEAEDAAAEELEEPEPEPEPEPAEETDEQLLERLGLNLEAALEEATSELTPPLLEAWLQLERQRQADQWQPRQAEAAAAARAAAQANSGHEAADEEEEEEEEAEHRTLAWRDVRRLLWRFESAPARQQLLAGCLRLLGAPLPGALPSNSAAASAAAGGCDELWWAAAAAGCLPGRCSSDGHGPTSSGWVGDLLCQGDWAWLTGSSSGGASQLPAGLRQRPWYLEEGCPPRRAVLRHLLTALLRGPCKGDAGLAAALMTVCLEAGPVQGSPAAALQPACSFDAAAEQLAKQLLSEQRANLALWQAYARLQVARGDAKAARKVYRTCFATVGAPAGLAAAATAAPLVLGAVQLELCGSISRAGAAALPSATSAAPTWSGCSLLAALAGGASPNGVLAAARQLAWLGSGGEVGLPAAPGAGGATPLAPEELVAAKRGFQNLLLSLMRQQQDQQASSSSGGGGGAGLGAGGRALVTAAAAFEQLAGHQRGDLAGGVKAALAIYEQVLAALTPAQPAPGVQQRSAGAAADAELELLAWQRCQLAADAARCALPCAPPAAAREALLRALQLYPGSPALLQLLVGHELVGHTLAQLRRQLHGLLDLHATPQLWLAMVALEVATHSPAAVVHATLERAVAHPSGRHCPALWRCLLRFQAAGGRHDAARRTFLRAIGACPWAKAVWVDGLALLNGHAPPKELAEYLETMRDKQLVVRTDALEAAFAQLEAQQGLAPGGGGGGAGE